MKTTGHWLAFSVLIVGLFTLNLPASTFYVDANGTNPVPPYADWSAAATNIQDAIDASSDGDLILVTNGIYQTGGRVVYGSLTNRVVINKAVTVQSVNGPAVTIIQGYQDANTILGDDAVRCVYLTNNAVLSGFTLTNGATRTAGDNNTEQCGGGVWCEDTSATITNCILTANTANYLGGGADAGTLNSCLLSSNSSEFFGGGAENSDLNQCTFTGNTAFQGGGAGYSTLNNCSLASNSAYYSGGADSCTVSNTTFTGNSAAYGGGTGNSTLTQCALANNSASQNGGGAESSSLANCTLTGNSALSGGGADSSGLNNCALADNAVLYSGGAAENCNLNNCTLVFNSATGNGGGADGGTLNNCIIYHNSSPGGTNYSNCTLNFCCTTPDPAGLNGSMDNITAEPQLTDIAHIGAGSPCIGAGSTNYSAGTDLDGKPWLSPPSIGCDEYYAGVAIGSLSVAVQADYTNVSPGFAVDFAGLIYGHAGMDVWDFGDGTRITNQLSVSHSWALPGNYPVTLTAFNGSNPGGISATAMVYLTSQQVYYVAAGNPNPIAPFLTWNTAATNIQDAVDVAVPGGLVLVSNGVYQTGGRMVYGSPTNRVVISKDITVESVNGPSVTAIQGNQDTNTVNGSDAVRCVYLTAGAILSGFTLTNGATLIDQFESFDNHLYSGGGVYCESSVSIVSNCVVTTCSASDIGGGAAGGTLNNCFLTNNMSSFGGGGAGNNTLNNCIVANNSTGLNGYAGGIYNSTVNQCVISHNSSWTGGGAYNCTLTNCTLTANSATYSGGADTCTLDLCTLTGNSASSGGGAGGSTLSGCLLTGNSASQNGAGIEGSTAGNCTLNGNSAGGNGGGADGSTLNNCALAGNSAGANGGGAENGTLNDCNLIGNSTFDLGGGADNSTLNNCIVFDNAAPGQANYSSSCTLNYCCTSPLPVNGTNDLADDPQLTDDAHIGAGSPCIGAGSTNYSTGVDLDGQPWLNPPSIGCNEFYAGAPAGSLSVTILAGFTNVAAGFAVDFTGLIAGHAGMDVWDFGDGTRITNQLSLSHSWSTAGVYPVVLTAYNAGNPGGVNTTVFIQVLQQPVAYVSVNSTNPVPPYLSWGTAATNVQDAVDVAVAGGTIWVTNGIYNTGGRVVFGMITNRVAVTKPITVRSVNGASVTTIEGFSTNDNISDIRCVYMTNGAALLGFTLTNGATIQGNDYVHEWSGAGVWCEASSAVVSNCVFVNNTAQGDGGGIYDGTAINCIFTNNYGYDGGGVAYGNLAGCTLVTNSSYYGGGVFNSTLTNCALTGNFTYIDDDYTANGGGACGSLLTNCVISGNSSLTGGGASACTLVNCLVTGNVAEGAGSWPPNGGGANGSTLVNCTVIHNSAVNTGGGVNVCTVTNCIVYFNTAPNGTNYSDDSTLSFCDTATLPANGIDNITGDPLFADGEHIAPVSPCRGAGSASATSGADIDGDAWLVPPSIGCDEYYSSSATGALATAISATFTNVATGFTVDFVGQVSGHATANRWDFGDGTIISNELVLSHSWNLPGNYPVTFTAFNTDHPAGVGVSVTLFVLQNPVHYVAPGNPTPVSPYLSWTTAATNIQDAIDVAYAGGTVLVSNGVYQTGMRVLYNTRTNRVAVTKPLTLQSVNGAAVTVIDGGGAVRCLYLTNHVFVTGFTLQNGAEVNGAGVYCESSDDLLTGCVLTNNSSPADGSGGGGVDGGTLNYCVLAGNSANYLGGGAANATLNFCVLTNNVGLAYGGAACYCTLNNCLCVGNWAGYAGGGAIWSTLNDCTVVSNIVPPGPGTSGGAGVFDGTVNNCIVYDNDGDDYDSDWGGIQLNYCCTTPLPSGPGNITNDPAFLNPAAGDYQLQTNSPCINSGDNTYLSTTNDLAGNPRISGRTVDMGAYEYQNPSSILSYAWAQQYGLPTDGSVDYSDLDGTGMPNWEKSIAELDPTNSASVLVMSAPAATSNASGITVTWQSVQYLNYFLQRSSDLTQPFTTIQSNLVGQVGTTSYTDPDATNSVPYFYRVGIQ